MNDSLNRRYDVTVVRDGRTFRSSQGGMRRRSCGLLGVNCWSIAKRDEKRESSMFDPDSQVWLW